MAFPITAIVVLGCATPAPAEEKASSSPPIPASNLPREEFKSLPADAVIDFDGERITKGEFVERRTKALAQAISNLNELRAKAEREFEARRKAFIEAENERLDAANKQVQAEVERLATADAAAHGSNWEARRKKASMLLEEAEAAAPGERSRLEKEAADLLSPTRPQQ